MFLNIHAKFEGIGLAVMDDGYSVILDRPYMVDIWILLRKVLRNCINFVFYENHRCIRCEVSSKKSSIYL